MSAGERPPVGIEALNVYCGLAQIPVQAMFAGRGLDEGRLGNLMMYERSLNLPFEDPVTNAVNAAKPIVDALDPAERDRIEILITSTESGIDYSKSVASYVHDYLGLSRQCRVMEAKQACYAATGAVQMAAAYVASGMSPGAKVLIIATDVSLVDQHVGYTEPVMGAGAAAVLVSDRPRILTIDLGAFGNYAFETLDSARPGPTFDIADVDGSLFAYLDCLKHAFLGYRDRVDGTDFATTFDFLVMHTPFAGIVKAGHRKMMREFAGSNPAEIEQDFARRVLPSLTYGSKVGNLCSGAVYLALASLIDAVQPDTGYRVGLYSYGSGCCSEFFSGLIDEESTAALAQMQIARHLAGRRALTFDEYVPLLKETLQCLVPQQDRDVDIGAWRHILDERTDRRPLLALNAVRN
ncbi:MAG TPA: hydroxymethylglutaryl-CoA synthase, partial [Thermoanaerobaculia bacterium]|nr:hydroxymethylglutaryl-CoA synthase [Thermoanaerobaculia bacterium]